MISRRLFLALTGGTLAAPSASWAADSDEEDQVPALLDHIILGCKDLDRGIDLVEENTGVRPAIGGVHPGRGTCNALLSLGERRYLEIIAPDPAQQKDRPLPSNPRKCASTPHRLGRPSSGHRCHRKQLGENKIAFQGPDTARESARWRRTHLEKRSTSRRPPGSAPFLIEWSADSVHPSKDAPKRCSWRISNHERGSGRTHPDLQTHRP